MKVVAALQNGALESELEAHGLEVLRLNSVEGVAACCAADPSFAVIDEALPIAAELIVGLKALVDGPDRDRLPIFAINSTQNGLLRCEPDAFLKAPTAETIVEASKAIVMRRARQRRLVDQEVVLRVPTTPEQVDRAAELLEQLIKAAGFNEDDSTKLEMIIREAVGNAAEHGNQNDPERKIHINYLRSSDRLTIVVTDEGEGFDTSNFLSRADEVSPLEHTRSRRETEDRPGGLGVFMMKKTCDTVAFNEVGNSIYLMKFLPGHASS